MVTTSIILGILFIITGFVFMCSPVEAFFSLNYIIAALLLVYGVWGVVRFIKKKAGANALVASILAVIVGFIYVFRPGDIPDVGNVIGLDRVALFIIALWFLIKGCLEVKVAAKLRNVTGRWVWGLIVGLFSILLGVYSFIHPFAAAVTSGVLTGFFFIQCGFDLLVFGTAALYVKKSARQMDDNVRSFAAAALDSVKEAAEANKEAAHARREAAEAKRDAILEAAAARREAAKAAVKGAGTDAADAADTSDDLTPEE